MRYFLANIRDSFFTINHLNQSFPPSIKPSFTSFGVFCIFITTASRVSGKHTNILVVVGKYVCNSRKVDLGCGLTCVFQHRLPAALGAIFLPPCLYNTNTEATEKFKFIISTAHSESLFMDLFRPIFHAVLHCIPVSCQLGK